MRTVLLLALCVSLSVGSSLLDRPTVAPSSLPGDFSELCSQVAGYLPHECKVYANCSVQPGFYCSINILDLDTLSADVEFFICNVDQPMALYISVQDTLVGFSDSWYINGSVEFDDLFGIDGLGDVNLIVDLTDNNGQGTIQIKTQVCLNLSDTTAPEQLCPFTFDLLNWQAFDLSTVCGNNAADHSIAPPSLDHCCTNAHSCQYCPTDSCGDTCGTCVLPTGTVVDSVASADNAVRRISQIAQPSCDKGTLQFCCTDETQSQAFYCSESVACGDACGYCSKHQSNDHSATIFML